ncbi:MAG: hypothetical protein IPG08_10310 [Sphingobacteriaceae bacterium]|nr:hypothetical protein [Sphingobacteriaceae bacterium]
MDEIKIDIQLSPDLVKDYHYSRDIYKSQMQYLDKNRLYIGLPILVVSVFLLIFYPIVMLSVLLIVPLIALVNLWQHFKLYYLRMRWFQTVDTTAKIYKDVSLAKLEINESGVGLRYNEEYEFLYWDSLKEFDILYNKFLLIYSGEKQYIFRSIKRTFTARHRQNNRSIKIKTYL